MPTRRMLSLTLLAATSTLAYADREPILLDLESGAVWQRYNNARVPNDSASTISVASLAGRDARFFGRVQVVYGRKDGPQWRLLIAPLSLSGTGRLDSASQFKGTTFGPGDVRASYRFDSYRLTYRNKWRDGWSIGVTAKLRRASIGLEQGSLSEKEVNEGFVPLLHIHGEKMYSSGWGYEVEFDGLAGGPGRAFDTSVRLLKSVGPQSEAFVGLRVLEGGADVPRVYNFAWLTFATAGVRVRF